MKEDIKKLLENAILEAKKAPSFAEATAGKLDFSMSEIIVDHPKSEQFGDYISNIAMVLAKKIGKNPMEIAEILKSKIFCSRLIPETNINIADFEKIEVAHQ